MLLGCYFEISETARSLGRSRLGGSSVGQNKDNREQKVLNKIRSQAVYKRQEKKKKKRAQDDWHFYCFDTY